MGVALSLPYAFAAAPFVSQGFSIVGGVGRTVGGRLLNLARSNWKSAAWDFGTQSVFNLMNSDNPLASNNYSTTLISRVAPKKYFCAGQALGNAFGFTFDKGYIGYGSNIQSPYQTTTNILLGASGSHFSRAYNYGAMKYLNWNRPWAESVGNFYGSLIFGTPQWIIDNYYRQ